MQQLKRQGKTPKFGSYEYDAQRLHEKGVLVELKEVPAGKYVAEEWGSGWGSGSELELGCVNVDADALCAPVAPSSAVFCCFC